MAEKYLNSYNFRIAQGAAMQRCHRSLEALVKCRESRAEQSVLVRDLQKEEKNTILLNNISEFEVSNFVCRFAAADLSESALCTYLHRLEDIHARMASVALLALVAGLARCALLAADAIETLHKKLSTCHRERYFIRVSIEHLPPRLCRRDRPSCRASLACRAVQVDRVDLQLKCNFVVSGELVKFSFATFSLS